MKLDFETSDLMRIAGLGRRKKKPEDKKYGRFNRRMMAATIDSLALVAMAPLLDPIFAHFYGPALVDLQQLQAQAQMQPTPEEAAQLYWGTLYATGFFRRYFTNTAFQFGVLALIAAFCWFKWSATPGKMIMRLKIVDAKTELPISWLQCILRALGYFISGIFFGLGFFWIGIDKRRQGWHDKLAGTVVVTVPWSPFSKGKTLPAEQEVAAPTPASEVADPSDSPAP